MQAASCSVAGCSEPRHRENSLLCAEHQREQTARVPSIYPMCATDGCPRRARARVPGGLCKPCRRDAGDTTVTCITEGCTGIRALRGLCDPCLTAGRQGYASRAMFPPSDLCARDGCGLRPGKKNRFCNKHSVNRDACLTRGCVASIVADGGCGLHRPGTDMCRIWRCGSLRYRGSLCRRHYENRNMPICAKDDCGNATPVGNYCGIHDVGIDFVAGDWFDWVAVEQLWWGRLDPGRKPTAPELHALFDRAERNRMGVAVLARQMRMEERRLVSWKQILHRIKRQDADIAQAVAA